MSSHPLEIAKGFEAVSIHALDATPRPSRLQAVIVGAGLMGRFHAAEANRAGARIVGIVDPDLDAAHRLKRHFPAAKIGVSLTEIARETRPDVVHICSPEDRHCEQALEVASVGAHSLVEKPIAPDCDAAFDVMRAFRDSRLFVIPAHQYAFQPIIDRTRRRLPAAGTVRKLSFDIRSAGASAYRGTPDQAASVILPHPLSLIQRFFPAHAIDRLNWMFRKGDAGEWELSTTVEATLVSISISMNARPVRFTTHIVCDGGEFVIDNFNGFATFAPPGTSRLHKVGHHFFGAARLVSGAGSNLFVRIVRREFAYVGLRSLVSSFYGAIGSGDAGDLPISFANLLANVAICEAAGKALGATRRG